MTDRTAALAAYPLRPLVEAHGVKLHKRGAHGWYGQCPFHDDRTPSFTVDDKKGLFYCFGCGAGGSVVDWLMRTKHLTAGQALRQLGIAADPTPQPPPRSRQREAQADFERLVMRLEVTWTTMLNSIPFDGDAAHRYDRARFDLHVFFSQHGFLTWEDWVFHVIDHETVHDVCVGGENGVNVGSSTNKPLLRAWATEHGWPLWTWLGHECRVRLFDAAGEFTAAGVTKLREKGELEWQ